MTADALPFEFKRVKIAQAIDATGKGERVVQQMAEAGEIPGAVKIRGEWTFNLKKLLAWVDELERQQCQTRKAAGDARPRRTPSGEAAPFTAGRASPASSSDGRYKRAMSNLLNPGSRRTSRG